MNWYSLKSISAYGTNGYSIQFANGGITFISDDHELFIEKVLSHLPSILTVNELSNISCIDRKVEPEKTSSFSIMSRITYLSKAIPKSILSELAFER